MDSRRLGYWSSVALLVVGILYSIALAFGFARHGFREPIADPVLAVMETLTLLSAPLVVLLAVAVHDAALPNRKFVAVVGIAFATLFAGTTSAVHFIELTAGRQLGDSGLVWPSRRYAAELLAWDVFLGITLVAFACAFNSRDGRTRTPRVAATCGACCLLGALGPLVGDMRLQRIGIFGYAVILPFLAFLLMTEFERQQPESQLPGAPEV